MFNNIIVYSVHVCHIIIYMYMYMYVTCSELCTVHVPCLTCTCTCMYNTYNVLFIHCIYSTLHVHV